MAEASLRTAAQQRRLSGARAVVGWFVMELGGGTLTEAGRRLNRAVGALRSAVQRVMHRTTETPELKRRLERLRSLLK